ncbi:glycosyltransferase [Streptomyces sp. SID11726]|nr:glycosyltransferase [Streptomyces sp. SID11726]
MATVVTPDGAYGGPITVARNMSEALIKRGYSVALVAGYRGYDRAPRRVGRVPSALFPVRSVGSRWGFAGYVSPGLILWLLRSIRANDIVHVHIARDLVTLPAAVIALLFRRNLVLQPHGMIDAPSRMSASLIDAIATRWVLAKACTVMCLTQEECAEIRTISPRSTVRVVPNGVPESPVPLERSRPLRKRVLFLARLHRRKRPTVFVEAARSLLHEGIDAEFEIAGPDEGELDRVVEAVAAANMGDRIVIGGPVAPGEVPAHLARADVYVLPSVDEPFPMTALEAMSVGTPVIVTRTCGIAKLVTQSGAGAVVDESVADLVAAIRQLITDDDHWRQVSRCAERCSRDEFGMDAVLDTVVEVYDGLSRKGCRSRGSRPG